MKHMQKKIHEALLDYGFRSEIDLREEKLGYKIREAQSLKNSLSACFRG